MPTKNCVQISTLSFHHKFQKKPSTLLFIFQNKSLSLIQSDITWIKIFIFFTTCKQCVLVFSEKEEKKKLDFLISIMQYKGIINEEMKISHFIQNARIVGSLMLFFWFSCLMKTSFVCTRTLLL